jgi:hypothetical protein
VNAKIGKPVIMAALYDRGMAVKNDVKIAQGIKKSASKGAVAEQRRLLIIRRCAHPDGIR